MIWLQYYCLWFDRPTQWVREAVALAASPGDARDRRPEQEDLASVFSL